MIKIPNFVLWIIGVFLLFISLSSFPSSPEPIQKKAIEPTPTAVIATPPSIAPVDDINNLVFQDNKDLYKNDDPSSVVAIYVTVRKGNILENTNYTWEEVNFFTKWTNGSKSADDIVGQAEAIVQFGDENGPIQGELGYDAKVPNATIKIRGASSSQNPAPNSYKIELYDATGTWRGQSTIALNKHYYDLVRIKNKLTFDLLKDMPNMISLRTQFVRLFVKDETTEPVSNRFVDYGLFTQVEQVNKAFLVNRKLDPNAQLYKATSFEFFRYADQIRLESDPLFDLGAFSDILEIKGNNDHSKLIRMLEDINNYEIPITQIFEKYFDVENYFTWMAFNILVGNADTQNQNFYLYSPQNSEKWYFIPWDFDGDLSRLGAKELNSFPYLDWEEGFANYWGVVLHNRVLRVEKYRLMLDSKVNELSLLMPPEKIENMLKIYRDVTEPFINRPPDLNTTEVSQFRYNLAYSLIPAEIENNKILYFEAQKKPLPFFLGVPEISNGLLKFNWDEAYNLTPQNVRYQFLVSRDINFSNIVFEDELVNTLDIEIDILEPGQYYWRVIATNEQGKIRYPFDAYFGRQNGSSVVSDGTKYFTITPEGDVIESQ